MRTTIDTLLGMAGLILAAVVFGFLLFAHATTTTTNQVASRAEAIVVLTGGAQRVRIAGQLLQARQARRLLISGVNRVVKRAEVRRMLGVDSKLFHCCVDIDYAAQNTRGNAIETRKWARNHEFKSIIVVTSSYHMPRSLTELGHLLPAVDLIAHPVVPERLKQSPWWLDRQNVMLLGSEYLKYLPSAAQFGIGRLTRRPEPAGGQPKQVYDKAVAIQ